ETSDGVLRQGIAVDVGAERRLGRCKGLRVRGGYSGNNRGGQGQIISGRTNGNPGAGGERADGQEQDRRGLPFAGVHALEHSFSQRDGFGTSGYLRPLTSK